MDTLQYVQACLDRTQTPVREIARESGVGESWLYMFKHGRIPDPGYSRIKLLADYFLRVGSAPVLVDGHPGKHWKARSRPPVVHGAASIPDGR